MAKRVQVFGEVVGRHHSVWMAVAKDSPAAGEGFLVECASLLVFAQRAEISSEVVGRVQGVGMVVAENMPAPAEGVLVEGVGLLVFAQGS